MIFCWSRNCKRHIANRAPGCLAFSERLLARDAIVQNKTLRSQLAKEKNLYSAFPATRDCTVYFITILRRVLHCGIHGCTAVQVRAQAREHRPAAHCDQLNSLLHLRSFTVATAGMHAVKLIMWVAVALGSLCELHI